MKKLVLFTFLLAFAITSISAKESVDDSDLFRKNIRVEFLNTEFLYWTATCQNNEYAFQYDRAILDGSYYHGLGKYVFSKSGWNPGFRVSTGYFNAPKTYQVVGQYIWVKMSNVSSIKRTQPYGQPICATFPQFDLGMNQIDEAKSEISLSHQLGDFLATRVWYPNLHCRMRLIGGLTGGKIQQKWDVAYTDTASRVENVYNKWRFIGMGFRLGLNIDWFWTRYFYITGKLTMAPLIGRYNYLGKISLQPDNGLNTHFKYDQYRGTYNIQAYFGPSYQRAFTKLRYEIFVGYELNSWFNVQEKIINNRVLGSNYLNTEETPTINRSLLMLHGLTARLTLDF